MIVVAIVGILSVLGIYGVRKYVANAKTAEARNSLGRIAKDAATAVEREKGSTTIVAAGSVSAIMRAFCGASAASIPAAATSIKGQKYQATTAEWASGTGTSGWQCLKFTMDEPQYFMYSYGPVNTDPAAGSFVATANGDLNGDGVLSTFQVFGSSQGGTVTISPNVQETNPEE
jgi:type IV pilus assembly protein PilA